MEDKTHRVYVGKRPGVEEFLRVMGQHYEVVVFTASIPKVTFFLFIQSNELLVDVLIFFLFFFN